MFRGPFHACYLGYAIGGEYEGTLTFPAWIRFSSLSRDTEPAGSPLPLCQTVHARLQLPRGFERTLLD
jgi:hypothetical protein